MSDTGNKIGDPQNSEAKPNSKPNIKALALRCWIVVRKSAVNFLRPFQYIDGVGFFTAVLCFVAWLQWRTLDQTDHTLHETLVASQRPWISVSVELADKYIIGENGASFTLKLTLENHGNSPAISVNPIPLMFADSAGTTDVGKFAKERCDNNIPWSEGFGLSVFPKQIVHQNIVAGLPKGQIAGAIHGDGATPNVIYFGAPLLICIDYRHALSAELKRTAVLYQLSQSGIGKPLDLYYVGTYAD